MTQIDAKNYIAPKTGVNLVIAWTLFLLVAPVFIIGTIIATMGLAVVGWLIAWAFYYSRIKKAEAVIRGSAVQASPSQFPEVYHTAWELANRLGMSNPPEIYVIESNEQNAFALKHGSKAFVVLIDDIVYGATQTGNEKVLSFIIGHELAHHALGHTRLLRGMLRTYFRPLARLDEFSCDAVGHALVGDSMSSRDALALLLVGPHLYKSVNRDALDAQAQEVAASKYSYKAEKTLSHPLMLRRYARLMTL